VCGSAVTDLARLSLVAGTTPPVLSNLGLLLAADLVERF
jgi:hypothetical protein